MNRYYLKGFIRAIYNTEEGDVVMIASKKRKQAKPDIPQIVFPAGVPFKKKDFVSIKGKFTMVHKDDNDNQRITGLSIKKASPDYKNQFIVKGIVKKYKETEDLTKMWIQPEGENDIFRFISYRKFDFHAGDHVQVTGAVQTSRRNRNGDWRTLRNYVIYTLEPMK